MKWTKELDEELKKLISLGKKYDEISVGLNTSIRSITNRAFRLDLKLIFTKEFKCEQCEKYFIGYANIDRRFCSNTCSNTFTNLHRLVTIETKEKISKSLTGVKCKNKKSKINKEKKHGSLNRKCKFCGDFKITKKHKSICDDCRVNYYENYRPSCEFVFDIKKYKDNFDFNLVEQHGWYSPTNKGDNLNGVSRDHMYCVRDGFINKIDPEIIRHPANCKLMKHTDNNLKNYTSSITLEELKLRITEWNILKKIEIK